MFTHFPKDLNCEVCRMTKTTHARCKTQRPQKRTDGILPPLPHSNSFSQRITKSRAFTEHWGYNVPTRWHGGCGQRRGTSSCAGALVRSPQTVEKVRPHEWMRLPPCRRPTQWNSIEEPVDPLEYVWVAPGEKQKLITVVVQAKAGLFRRIINTEMTNEKNIN